MKLLLTFFLAIILYPCYSQKTEGPQQIDINTALVAKNSRHTRIYRNGTLVKVFYRNPVDLKKIKGTLFALRDGRIQVAPFGRKQISAILVFLSTLKLSSNKIKFYSKQTKKH